jgi:SAM-dependent methyltransferase
MCSRKTGRALVSFVARQTDGGARRPASRKGEEAMDRASTQSETQDSINRRVYYTQGVEQIYRERGLYPTEALALLRVIAEFPHRDILDLGVGTGRTGRYLSQLASHYECIDYSPVMIEHLQKNAPELHARQGDMRDLSAFDDQSFDFVFAAANLVDAVGHADRLKVLHEVHRVLRPGGAFLFSSHNRNYIGATEGPRLRMVRNPIVNLKNVVRYFRQSRNFARLSQYRVDESEYALLVDEAGHDYQLLHYHIDRKSQQAQLAAAGFELVYAISERLAVLHDGDDDSQSMTLQYIARRV